MGQAKFIGFVFACGAVGCLGQGRVRAVPARNSSLYLSPLLPGAGAPVATRRIVLDMDVTDASGKPLPDLKPEDFAVLNNQKPQAIATFLEIAGNPGSATAHVVLVLDAVNTTSSNDLKRQVKETEDFLSAGSGALPYPISLALVTESGLTEVPQSRDRDALRAALQDLARNVRVVDCATQDTSSDQAGGGAMDSGVTGGRLDRIDDNSTSGTTSCLSHHVEVSLSALAKISTEQAGTPGRALIVWIGPGWPLLSGRAARDFTQNRAGWFERAVKLTNTLRDAQATLDVVSPTDLEHGKEFRHVDWNAMDRGAADPKQATALNLSLPVVARQSGGEVFNKSKDVAADIAACLGSADHYYAVSFEITPAAAPNELHTIQVKVNRSGAAVHAATLYYAQP